MLQTRRGSLFEAIINTIIGLAVSFIVWPIAAYLFSVEYNAGQQVGMVVTFTVASVARGYVVRRWFNGMIRRMAERMAGGGNA